MQIQAQVVVGILVDTCCADALHWQGLLRCQSLVLCTACWLWAHAQRCVRLSLTSEGQIGCFPNNDS